MIRTESKTALFQRGTAEVNNNQDQLWPQASRLRPRSRLRSTTVYPTQGGLATFGTLYAEGLASIIGCELLPEQEASTTRPPANKGSPGKFKQRPRRLN